MLSLAAFLGAAVILLAPPSFLFFCSRAFLMLRCHTLFCSEVCLWKYDTHGQRTVVRQSDENKGGKGFDKGSVSESGT